MPITLSDKDISRVAVEYAANALPVCNLTVANKDGVYTSASNILDEGMPIVISTSDNYKDFVRLFSGSIYQKESNLSPDGQSMLYLRCRDERLARTWVECNQGVVDHKDVGGAFTGSATSTDGSPWAADSQGNYPNGLLYETGFSLSDPGGDVANYYTDSTDIPKIVFSHEPRFTAINRIADLFDLRWYISPSDQTFEIYSGKVDYGTTDYTASYGENINRSSLLADNLRSCSGVRVFGPAPYFFETGSEPFHEVYDGGLSSLTEAKEIGLRWYENYTVSTKGGTIRSPIITASIIGRNIGISDSARGWDDTGDVIGVRHDISPDRAMTELTIDNEKFTQPKTLADILEELDKMRQDENYTGKFDCFKHLDRTDSDVTTASTAPGGSPCAIVIGTKSSVVTSTPEKVIDVQPIVGKIDNTYYSYWGPKIAETWNFDGDAILLKEIAVVNNPTGDLLNATRTASFNTRPTSEAAWDNDANWEYDLGTFSYAIDYVQLDYDQPLITEDDVKIGWTDSADYTYDKLHPTAAVWQDSDEHYVVSSSELKSMSWDYISKSGNYFHYTHSVGAVDDEMVGMRIAIDTHLTKYEKKDLDYLRVNVVGRVSAFDGFNGDPMTDFNIMLYFADTGHIPLYDGPTDWNTYYNTISGWNYYTARFQMYGYPWPQIDGGGKAYVLITPSRDDGGPRRCSASSDVVFEIAYVEHAFERGQPSNITICEKVTYTDDGYGLQVSHPIGVIHGFYSTSVDGVCSGSELGVYKSYLSWDGRCRDPIVGVRQKVNLQDFYKGNVVGQSFWSDTLRQHKINWRDLMGVLGVDDLYMKYTVKWEKPTNMERIPSNTKLYKIDRADNAGLDKVRWVRATSSADILQGHKKPLYGETVSYNFTEAGYDATVSARWTSSVGLDKTLDKTLTVAWQDK